MNTEKNKSEFQFSNPTLVEAAFFENLNYKDDFAKIGTLKLKISKVIGKFEELTEDKTATTVFLTVTTSDSVKLTDDVPCFLRVTMKASFAWNKNNISASSVKDFLNINAPSLLLSYIRTKVTELTADADIPTQHIPFVDFSNSQDEQSEK